MGLKEIDIAILAGGKSERMGIIGEKNQKCVLVVENKPVLTHILENIQSAFGSAKVVISVGHKSRQVTELYGNHFGNKIDIEYCYDNQIGQGVRLAVVQAIKSFKGPFLVLSGDIITPTDQYAALVDKLGVGITGVLSGASDHSPAPTHATIQSDINNSKILEINFPPKENFHNTPNLWRSMDHWYFAQKMIERLTHQPANLTNISLTIQKQISSQDEYFLLAPYTGEWKHIYLPTDID